MRTRWGSLLATALVASTQLSGCQRFGCVEMRQKYYYCVAPSVEQAFSCDLRRDATCEWSKECRDCVATATCQDLPSLLGIPRGTFPDCFDVCPDLPRE
jgi:hypothetical protein